VIEEGAVPQGRPGAKNEKRIGSKVFGLKTIQKRIQNRLSMEELAEGTMCPNGAPPK
ncbi:hypothetical protein KI387_033588, partial [Taxus chinensis]